ncbi:MULTISPECIES: thioredoxin family protein [Lysinibacillus]|uniref:Thiol reductase thioredoxin n=1 Tax=Lysinibacillus fusiformis TaxID=28031 RepID=A0A1E4QZ28_9BACI|nr:MULTISPECIES: thioredoxin family protein [Lysinibacillus]MBD8522687.1 thioredoxin family protein [Lysinibacillus fusiformis]MCR8855144.1 thioredoxin family protein [Lysinibacillus fusiformis]MED4886726.1 thioredoxin family protein [Lysinibacillus fusiformis]ODV53438.1 thiol reductase thioredoxin [Lysinibacillus fusiformis]WKT76838.1 thioredoxin family protein [Lysinibacillus fusiformis]
MEEWSKEQWETALQSGEKAAFYLYTPMCGTCAVASKMMSIVEQLLPHLKLGKANINFLEQIAIEHQIESVPCLLVCDGGKVTEKIYAFQSVPFLYELLKKSID